MRTRKRRPPTSCHTSFPPEHPLAWREPWRSGKGHSNAPRTHSDHPGDSQRSEPSLLATTSVTNHQILPKTNRSRALFLSKQPPERRSLQAPRKSAQSGGSTGRIPTARCSSKTPPTQTAQSHSPTECEAWEALVDGMATEGALERGAGVAQHARSMQAGGSHHNSALVSESFSPRWGSGFYYILLRYKAFNCFSLSLPFQSTQRSHKLPQKLMVRFPIPYPQFLVIHSHILSEKSTLIQFPGTHAAPVPDLVHGSADSVTRVPSTPLHRYPSTSTI